MFFDTVLDIIIVGLTCRELFSFSNIMYCPNLLLKKGKLFTHSVLKRSTQKKRRRN